MAKRRRLGGIAPSEPSCVFVCNPYRRFYAANVLSSNLVSAGGFCQRLMSDGNELDHSRQNLPEVRLTVRYTQGKRAARESVVPASLLAHPLLV